jgi:phosphoribosylanthranilate isomerase
MVWIKICGITNLKDARMVSELKVDSIGFILSTDSPRRVQTEAAAEIIETLREEGNRVSAAGVFVNEKIEYILECSGRLGLGYIQLSGDEDSDYLKDLKRRSGKIKIIKSVRIKNKNNNKETLDKSAGRARIDREIDSCRGYADFILFDSYRKGSYGGTGETFNWDIIKYSGTGIPVILSGGLDSKNVKRALDIVKPFGVDASSRLEIRPGRKDLNKVRQFVNAIRL